MIQYPQPIFFSLKTSLTRKKEREWIHSIVRFHIPFLYSLEMRSTGIPSIRFSNMQTSLFYRSSTNTCPFLFATDMQQAVNMIVWTPFE